MKILPMRMPGEDSSRERKRFMEEIRQVIVSNRECIRVEWKSC